MTANQKTPLELLLTNLPSRLENTRPAALQEYVMAKYAMRLTGRIEIDADRNSPKSGKGPHALPSGEIVIPIGFAERLWAIILGLFVTESKKRHERLAQDGISTTGAPTKDIYEKSISLLNDALLDSLYPWPTDAPNPNLTAKKEDVSKELGWWIGRTNNIFLDALTYLAAHEAAHLTQLHSETLKDSYTIIEKHDQESRLNLIVTTMEKSQARLNALSIEREADQKAREALLGDGVDENDRLPRGIAIIMAFSATLLLVSGPSGLRQIMHPDIDVRLRETLEALDPTESSDVDKRDILWAIAGISMYHACNRWKLQISIPSEVQDSWKTLTLFYFDTLEAEKQKFA